MPKGLSYEETLRIVVITAVSTAILTFGINVLFHWLKNKFDWFLDNKKFKREQAFNQLRELYLSLYGIIAQSEYIRGFFQLYLKYEFKDLPFIEITKKKKEIKVNMAEAKIETIQVDVVDAITEFNKINLAKEIITNGKYSSQDLLKLAVSYRFIHQHYLDETLDEALLGKVQDAELQLIEKIVRTIIIETNNKLKFCNMEYNDKELKTGILNIKS